MMPNVVLGRKFFRTTSERGITCLASYCFGQKIRTKKDNKTRKAAAVSMVRSDSIHVERRLIAYRHHPDSRYPDWVASDGSWPAADAPT